MAKLAIWTAVLLSFGFCIGHPTLHWMKKSSSFPLDMAPNSVDDMYYGCEDQMNKRVTPLLNREKNGEFKEAWLKAEQYYKTKWVNTKILKKEEIMALHAYTLENPPLYAEFNKAVRMQKCQYKKKKFKFYALHFLLTMALRSLKSKAKQCITAYRRTKSKFKTAVNKKIRFGAFTSSSVGSYPPITFGDQSCFEISTCFGAEISQFSRFESEKEVLIPPYEVFKITDISYPKDLLPCKVVYKLTSTKYPCSNLNCAFPRMSGSKFKCKK
ncbi:hypothetical protein CRENBAI_026455 [Crenichthys baileyi]|uniref:NAD(P)(+)--arginine ADP-ribosyltransferase n=1 Tax=Crenichthys baileyi TaxID=28760 RepID=A0AAV9R268_9TELE